MKFLKNIIKSIYSPEFYSKIPESKLKSAFLYFFGLALLLSTITILINYSQVIFNSENQFKNIAKELISSYPNKLVVTIKDSKISTNVEEPYFIKYNGNNSSILGKKYFVVIDTKTTYSEEQFKTYDALLWVTKDSILEMDPTTGKVVSEKIENVPNISITKERVEILEKNISPYYKYIGLVLAIIAFVFNFLGYSFNLIFLFGFALIVMFLSIAFRKNWSYLESYKVGMYALTIGLILNVIQGTITSSWNLIFVLIDILIDIIFLYFNIYGIKKLNLNKDVIDT